MTEGNFVDYVKLFASSGNGGKGSIHLHREKFITKGGPDGGDGGRGGHVIVKANKHLWTLYTFKFQKHFAAGHGGDGSKNRSSGAQGEDCYVEVPLGTVVRNSETNEILFEITEEHQEEILLQGGLGGRGNWHFKSSTRQTPRYAQPGIKGTTIPITLELKVLADVGLVGFPNAGKSTLLAAMTAAKPEIANYPFTTITPNLGIVKYRDGRSFIMADIPGIIENAHLGKGLGHRFLKHIERNAVLLFMVPSDADHIGEQYQILVNELKEFNEELLFKPRILAITKGDLIDEDLQEMLAPDIPTEIPHIFISAVTGLNLTQLKDMLWKELTVGLKDE